MSRKLYITDELSVLRKQTTETIDLVYMRPSPSKNTTHAFEGNKAEEEVADIWTLDKVDTANFGKIADESPPLHHIISSIGKVYGDSAKAYSTYMGVRLLEIHRILKQTAGLYYHCEVSMSPVVRQLLDAVFGKTKFRNEIVWRFGTGRGGRFNATRFRNKHENIYFYSRGQHIPNKDMLKFDDVWKEDDLNTVMERLILSSTNKRDLILDPFCGKGEFIFQGDKLNRKWIAIDKNEKAIGELEKFELGGKLAISRQPPRRGRTSTSDETKRMLYGYQRGICNGCDRALDYIDFQVDHIISLSSGGKDETENKQLLCGFCNARKGSRTMDWLRFRNKKDGLLV